MSEQPETQGTGQVQPRRLLPVGPRVVFIGSGPGEAGLMTARGADILADAALVVYDAHVHSEIVTAYVPQAAEVIDAAELGQSPSTRGRRLAELARPDKTVVRLSSDDGLLFTTTTTEAAVCRKAGIDVEIVIVDDDAALGSAEETAGRRGVAGTILVHKVAGAAAARGATLAEVKASAEAAIGAIASMGVALSSCTVPAAGAPNFELGPDEIEIGLGIHGEQGRERVSLRSAASLSEHLISQIVHDRGLGQGDEVALLVNNLGTTPPIELAIVTRGALAACRDQGLKVRRVWSGTFLTSLDMAGISLSLMRLDPDRLDALDAEACAQGWTPPAKDPASRTVPAPQSDEAAEARHGPAVSPQFIAALEAGCRALIDAEPELTKLDQVTGDGDIGRSLAGGAEAILAATDELAKLSEPDALRRIGQIIRARTGGTSGPLYAIFAFGAGEALRDATDSPAAERLELGFAAGLGALAALGGAAPGDRTMIDALAPAAKAMAGEGGAVQRLVAGAEAAAQGARATADMQARRGRSSYLGERVVGHRDPGAEAVARALAAAAAAVEGDRP